MARQLPLPLEIRPALTREGFIVGPPNATAVRMIDSWPDWPAPVVALHGPQGCGKSHLVEIWRHESGAELACLADLSADWLAGLAPDAAIAIEDLGGGAGASEERDRILLALFDRPSGALLLTAKTPPAEWPVNIGDLKSRFAAALAIPMAAPDDALLGGLAKKLFADRQLRVSEKVVARMLVALERTPAAISAFVAHADAKALAERRIVTERLVVELLEEL